MRRVCVCAAAREGDDAACCCLLCVRERESEEIGDGVPCHSRRRPSVPSTTPPLFSLSLSSLVFWLLSSLLSAV